MAIQYSRDGGRKEFKDTSMEMRNDIGRQESRISTMQEAIDEENLEMVLTTLHHNTQTYKDSTGGR